jgi:protein subunit release factor B
MSSCEDSLYISGQPEREREREREGERESNISTLRRMCKGAISARVPHEDGRRESTVRFDERLQRADQFGRA